jgi:hypothetical protein
MRFPCSKYGLPIWKVHIIIIIIILFIYLFIFVGKQHNTLRFKALWVVSMRLLASGTWRYVVP